MPGFNTLFLEILLLYLFLLLFCIICSDKVLINSCFRKSFLFRMSLFHSLLLLLNLILSCLGIKEGHLSRISFSLESSSLSMGLLLNGILHGFCSEATQSFLSSLRLGLNHSFSCSLEQHSLSWQNPRLPHEMKDEIKRAEMLSSLGINLEHDWVREGVLLVVLYGMNWEEKGSMERHKLSEWLSPLHGLTYCIFSRKNILFIF